MASTTRDVADPFRWLEEDSNETRAWTDAQNRATRDYFSKRGDLSALRARIAELLETGFCESPYVCPNAKGKRAFYTRREGAAQQPKLVMREGDDEKNERVIVDAEKLSSDATDALDWWYPSPSGARLVWGRSTAGSEKSVLFVRDVETGQDSDRIDDTQHCTVAWTSETTFFYTRHPPGDPYSAHVYFHELGRDPKDDPCVFGEGREKTDAPQPIASPCGKFLFIVVQQGWTKCVLWFRDLRDARSSFVPLVDPARNEEATFEVIVRRDAFFVLTDSSAPRKKLFVGDYENPKRDKWREVIAEGDDVLSSVAIGRDGIVCAYLRDASSVLVSNGVEFALPAIGSASVFSSPDDDDVYVAFTSFVVPFGVWKIENGALVPWARVARATSIDASSGDVIVERQFATSQDGTRIPLFVVRKKSTELPAKTILWGYGGFNVNQTPAFSVRALAFVERGGVWASAVLRGGGEFGEAWHRAGMLAKKQNVFDDFYACAEHLVREHTTTHRLLAALGGSNGGLLVSVAITQRPELFGAALALVPLSDMLRYHLFRLGAFWIPEYGSPEEPAAFDVLYKYSPLHRVTSALRYPPTLFWTAESDSRVDPMHARKMAATMQAAGATALLRVETNAGHGMGKPTAKIAEQVACELAFAFAELGKESPPKS